MSYARIGLVVGGLVAPKHKAISRLLGALLGTGAGFQAGTVVAAKDFLK